jgi:putative solute:sodium symporter small subunit
MADASTGAGGAQGEGPRGLREDPRVRACLAAYWRRNLRLMAALLAVWAVVGLGCGVLLADWLNRFALGGFPLGFWFAQQGSIVVFVALIGINALAMRRVDRLHHAELEALRREADRRAVRP